MSISTEISRISDNVSSALSAIADKGVTVPEDANSDSLATLIAKVETGVDTSDADATDGDIVSGKTAYVNGEKVTGLLETTRVGVSNEPEAIRPDFYIPAQKLLTYSNASGTTYRLDIHGDDLGNASAADVATGKTFTSKYGAKITGQADLISQIATALEGKAGGNSAPQTCTVTISKPTTQGYMCINRLTRYKDGEIKTVDMSNQASGGIQLFESGESGTKTITDVIVGTTIGIGFISGICRGTWDANARYITTSSGVTLENMDSFSTVYLDGPQTSTSSVHQGNFSHGFKILGDTSISLWDDD